MKKILFIFSSLIFMTLLNAQNTIGIFQEQVDVGNTKQGSARYNAQTQEYTIEGAGSNIWFNHDGFHYLYRQMKGDFILRCNASLLGKGVEDHRKLGWMVRASLDSTSACASVAVHGDGLTSLQYRKQNNDTMAEVRSSITGPDVIQLERKGNTYIMSVARNGETFASDSINSNMGDNVYIGLFVCSHNATVMEKGMFHNVHCNSRAANTCSLQTISRQPTGNIKCGNSTQQNHLSIAAFFAGAQLDERRQIAFI